MILIEKTTIADAVLPVDAFKDHLKLGRGFSDDSIQDAVLRGFLRAAIVSIEGRIGRVILRRVFEYEFDQSGPHRCISLPICPVHSVDEVKLYNGLGGIIDLDNTLYTLEKSDRSSKLSGPFPNIPQGGKLCVSLQAGMATDWDVLPADLAQAIFLLATHYYEYRHATTLGSGCTPFGVVSLIERYKVARLSLGGGQ